LAQEEEMRHPERKIKNGETIKAILQQSAVGRIGTVNRKGFPVIKPVNFLYWNEKIYIHSSMKGEKIRDIRQGSPVCFEVDEPIAYGTAQETACTGNYYYRSIVVKGTAALVTFRKRRLEILEKLMEKYQPEGGYAGMPEETLQKTAVIEISFQEVTGKEKLG
jgi:nitroimidazol reductase NimA-like FMN-containing flavoprotein (pyridoxamine 5'-phosphate oxidase superfamily)